jgi:hypothetical protein
MNNESYEPLIGLLVYNKLSILGSLPDSLWQRQLHMLHIDNESRNGQCYIYVGTQHRNIAHRYVGFACI